MKRLRLVTISLILFFCAYAITRKSAPGKITKIKVTSNFPLKYLDNHVEIVDLAFYVNYYKGYEIYELPYHTTGEINGKLIYDSLKYDLFIRKANADSGIHLKALQESFGAKIDLRKVLKERALQNMDILDSFKVMKIKNEQEVKTDSNVVHLFELDNQYYDSAKFFYNNGLNDIKFTFSSILDSVNSSKLYKFQYYFKDLSTITFEILKVPVTNEQELKNLFESFIKQEK
jgi:hypothetical protein